MYKKRLTLFFIAIFSMLVYKNISIHETINHQVARMPASENCTDLFSAILNSSENKNYSWMNVDSVLNFPGLNPMEASVLRNYLQSIPNDLQVKILNKFKNQNNEVTLRNLQEILDLHKINGKCQ